MDALALLCNLHADGPTTLHRLRAAGCDALDSLDALPDVELERVLGCGGSRPARFRTEAQLLQRRLESEAALDSEPGAELRPYGGPRRAPVAPDSPPHAPGIPDSLDEGRPLIDAVLQAWGEVGSSAPPAAPPARPPARETPPVEADPRQGSQEPAPGLDGLDLDGLDAPTLRALAGAGVTGVGALLAAEPLALSRSSAVPYTTLLRLQFLARRAGGTAAAAPLARAGERVPEPGPCAPEDPPPEHGETAGPFA